VNVLAIGAHPDDIELGCGATLATHRRRGDAIWLLVMTTGERGPQAARSRISEQEDAAALLGAQLRWGGFADGAVAAGRPGFEAKAYLVRGHVSQVLKNGLVDIEALEALARYRGFQARIRHAEAFEADRFVWDLAPVPSPVIPSDISELAFATEGVV